MCDICGGSTTYCSCSVVHKSEIDDVNQYRDFGFKTKKDLHEWSQIKADLYYAGKLEQWKINKLNAAGFNWNLYRRNGEDNNLF